MGTARTLRPQGCKMIETSNVMEVQHATSPRDSGHGAIDASFTGHAHPVAMAALRTGHKTIAPHDAVREAVDVSFTGFANPVAMAAVCILLWPFCSFFRTPFARRRREISKSLLTTESTELSEVSDCRYRLESSA